MLFELAFFVIFVVAMCSICHFLLAVYSVVVLLATILTCDLVKQKSFSVSNRLKSFNQKLNEQFQSYGYEDKSPKYSCL